MGVQYSLVLRRFSTRYQCLGVGFELEILRIKEMGVPCIVLGLNEVVFFFGEIFWFVGIVRGGFELGI